MWRCAYCLPTLSARVAEEDQLRSVTQNALVHPFEILFQYFDAMPKTKGCKFEEFISEVTDAPQPQ